MDVNTAINSRFSVRKFKNKTVEKEKLLQILEAGRLAPSAVNFQPWYFIIVQSHENLHKIHEIYPRNWIKTAQTVIIACVDNSSSWKRKADNKNFADINIAISVDHMTLQATELGLGTCWVCNFDAKRCSESFNIPSHIEPVVLLPVGYPDVTAPEKKRKSLEEIVRWEEF